MDNVVYTVCACCHCRIALLDDDDVDDDDEDMDVLDMAIMLFTEQTTAEEGSDWKWIQVCYIMHDIGNWKNV